MKKGIVGTVWRTAAILMLASGAAWGATSTSTWSTATSGDWTNAANWSVEGVPGAGSEARLTQGSGAYTATWSGGGAAFENLVITNAGANTTTLNIDAAGFANTNGTVRLGRGARVYVRPGGDWRWSGNNTIASPLVALDNDAELHIDGGSMGFSNVVGTSAAYAIFRIATAAGSTGKVYVTAGRLDYRNKGPYGAGFFVGTGGGVGSVEQSGGTVVVQKMTGGDNYDFRLGQDTGSVGEYRISGGVLSLASYMNIANGSNSRGTLRISGSGIVSNDLINVSSDFGLLAGSRGELNVSGGRYVSAMGNQMFGGNTGTGVLQVTGGEVNMRSGRIWLGRNNVGSGTVGRGIGLIGGGDTLVAGYGYGLAVGKVETANVNAWGTLTMTNGNLIIRDAGESGWSHLPGLVVGYVFSNNVSGFARGEFYLSGGTVTNSDTTMTWNGYLVLGYNAGATGTMVQTGGRYIQSSSRPAIVGYGGGVGTLIVSNGHFELPNAGQSLYVGGYTEMNTICKGVSGVPDGWANTVPSSGRLEVAGGTVAIGNSLVLGTNGTGTAVFSGGTTTAKGLHLVGANATLRFDLGPTGAGSLSVTNMTVGAGAKLIVDASAYDKTNGLRVKLAGCGARTGSFAAGDITVIPSGKAAVDQAGGTDIWLKFPSGTAILIQ